MQINAIVKFRSKRYFAKSLDKNFDPHNFGRRGGGGGGWVGGGENMFSDVKLLTQKYL